MNIPPVSRSSFKSAAAFVLLLTAIAFLTWSGSSWEPRSSIPWTFTKDGWLVFAPGLSFLWLSSGILFAVLSAWVYFQRSSPRRNPWLDASVIFLSALVARIVIATMWIPLPLKHFGIAARTLSPTVPWHGLLIGADLLTVALLLVALHRAGKSPWWAALYALHPLALIEVAGNGHAVAFVIPALLALVAFSAIFPRWLRLLISGYAAFASVATIASAVSHNPFNSLTAEFFFDHRVILPALAAVLEAAILLLALRRNWTLARTLAHIFVVLLLCSPTAQPWAVLPLLALLPLAWNNAAWALSLSVLAAYAAIPLLRSGEPWHIPLWLLMLEWIPVAVLEAQELLADSLSPRTSQLPPSALATTSLP